MPASLAAADTEGLLQLLLLVPLGAVASLGLGAATLVIRVIVPGPTAALDAARERMGTGRLFLGGILPLVGAGLLGRGVEMVQNDLLGMAYVLLVGIPMVLAWTGGLVAGLLHIGTQVLRADSRAAPLTRAALGGLVLGLALTSWIVPPLGLLVTLLLSAWFVGIGLGALLNRRARPEKQN